jgi:hypothetical protein
MGGWGEHLYLQLEVEGFGGGDAGNVTVHGTWDRGEQRIAWRRAWRAWIGCFFVFLFSALGSEWSHFAADSRAAPIQKIYDPIETRQNVTRAVKIRAQ